MSPQIRGLLIGMFGPAVQAVGVAWDLLDHTLGHHDAAAESTLRHILFGSAHLVIFAGFVLSLICIPLALQVVLASPEEVELPEFERESERIPEATAAESTR